MCIRILTDSEVNLEENVWCLVNLISILRNLGEKHNHICLNPY